MNRLLALLLRLPIGLQATKRLPVVRSRHPDQAIDTTRYRMQ